LAVLINWPATLVHGPFARLAAYILAAYVKYATQFSPISTWPANPYPPFDGRTAIR